MRKVAAVLSCIVLVLGITVAPSHSTPGWAQTSALPACSSAPLGLPMPGRYTGPWHSDADYHFAVFNTDLILTVTIDGTLDVTVTPDGRVSGVAKGTVDAPIYHNGVHDVSSGTGTISGLIQGIMTPTSSTMLLLQPVIAMQWGTFIPNGYTVPRSITMPNYQLPLQSSDCVSLRGGITEHNFPTQFVVADGESGLTQAPGIGDAAGSWNLSHVQSGTFSQLSQQVNSFIATADAVLAGTSGPLSPAAFNTSLLQPFKALLAAIDQNPDISRCLLERLNGWAAITIPSLRVRARALVSGDDLGALRQAQDLVRFSKSMQLSCTAPDDGTLVVVQTSDLRSLDTAISSRDWATVALALRESIVAGVDSGTATQRATTAVHALLQGPLAAPDKRDAARIAYALGDDEDARSALSPRVDSADFTTARVMSTRRKSKKRKGAPTPKPTRTATATPRPTATPTPKPLSLSASLQSGTVAMVVHFDGSANPTFSWQPIAGVARYVVFVTSATGAPIVWAWSGSATSVHDGDTSLPGLTGSDTETWPVAVPVGGVSWSVLALDAGGHIVGTGFRLAA